MDALHSRFRDSIITALEEILDKMVFMVFEPVSGGLNDDAFAYMSQITFAGRFTGSLTAYLTRATAEEFARNLIGIRKGDVLHTATLEDALREFSNILMGRALSLLAPNEHFELQLPQAQAGGASAGDHTFRIEGMLNEVEPCRIDVSLDSAGST